ncbi:MAG: hypothetical protein JWR59_1068 [Brevundimonas sp.]|nr:hypothetical protein [Brevundimonas sp.]
MRILLLAAAAAVLAGSAAQAAEKVAQAGWIRKPTLEEITAVYPSKAQGRQGSAVIKCTVSTTGSLTACSVVKETPSDAGFGAAALSLTPSFVLKPATRNGVPFASEVSIPVNFMGGDTAAGGLTVTVLRDAPWIETPTSADVRAAFPDSARGKVAEGAAALQCDLTKAGRLSGCSALNVSPPGMGFETQAKRLAAKFAVDPALIKASKSSLMVNLRITFVAPDDPRWANRYLTKVKWVHVVDPDAVQAVYPAAASAAGVERGSALVDCAFQANGALGDCRVAAEDPPALGFGAAATSVAEAVSAELWLEDGLPIEGARVKMPVKLVREAPTPATKH